MRELPKIPERGHVLMWLCVVLGAIGVCIAVYGAFWLYADATQVANTCDQCAHCDSEQPIARPPVAMRSACCTAGCDEKRGDRAPQSERPSTLSAERNLAVARHANIALTLVGLLLAVPFIWFAYRQWTNSDFVTALQNARRVQRTARGELDDAKNKAELAGEFASRKAFYDNAAARLDALSIELDARSPNSPLPTATEGGRQWLRALRATKESMMAKELDSIADEMRRIGYQRAHLLPYVDVLVEATDRVAEMRCWGVPERVIRPIECAFCLTAVGASGTSGGSKQAVDVDPVTREKQTRASLESLYDSYDYWDSYTDWYLSARLTPAVIVLGVVALALIGVCAWISHLGALSWVFALAGAAGASVSVAIRPPPMNVYGEAVGSLLGIAGRVVSGTTASFIGMALLASGLISIALPVGQNEYDNDGTTAIRLVPVGAMFQACRHGASTSPCRASSDDTMRVSSDAERRDRGEATGIAGAPATAISHISVGGLGVAGADNVAGTSPNTLTAEQTVTQKQHGPDGATSKSTPSASRECPITWMFLLVAIATLLGFCERVLPSFESTLLQGITGPNNRRKPEAEPPTQVGGNNLNDSR